MRSARAAITALGVVAAMLAASAPAASATSAAAMPGGAASPAVTNARTIAYTPVIGEVSATGKSKPPKITYHGGPTMANAAGNNVYVIWYGTWDDAEEKALVTTFITNLSNSKYWAINSAYTNASKKKISKVLTVAGQITDDYSQGRSGLNTASFAAAVSSAITTNALPKDENGIYLVLTSADVTVTDFMQRFCGWHTATTVSGSSIKFSFVGDADLATACTPQQTSPNGNARVDAMLSVIAHELAETVTDPNLNAWYDANNEENADKCAWTFGKTLTTQSGAKYNVTLNGKNYYLQQNWKKGGGCALK